MALCAVLLKHSPPSYGITSPRITDPIKHRVQHEALDSVK